MDASIPAVCSRYVVIRFVKRKVDRKVTHGDQPGGNEDGNARHKTQEANLRELHSGTNTACQGEHDAGTTDAQEDLTLGCLRTRYSVSKHGRRWTRKPTYPVATFKEEGLSNCSYDSGL